MKPYLAFIDEADGCFGLVIPDCPGCTAMGDTFEDAVQAGAEALREWMIDRLGDGFPPPPARSFAELRRDPALEEDFAAGFIITPLCLEVRAAATSEDRLRSSVRG